MARKSTMSNVISLAAVRHSNTVVVVPPTYQEISERIDLIAHKYVGSGAVLLLRTIALFINYGENELSYSFLCEHLGVARASLSKHIADLELHKFIRVRRSRIGKYNSHNQFEINFIGPLGEKSMLKMPKKFNEKGSSKNELPSRGVVQLVEGIYKHSYNKEILVPKGTGRFAPAFETAEEALQFVEKRIVRKRAEKVEKVEHSIKRGSPITLAGVKASWATAMLKHYPSVPPITFTVRDFAIFKNKVMPLLTTTTLTDLFDYFVSSWSTLRETKFIWLRVKGKDVALAPSLPELMRYWKIFAQAFADSKMIEANTDMKTRRTREHELEDTLQQEKAARAKAEAATRHMADRLAAAERLAYATKQPEEKKQSLSARRAKADRAYNEDYDIPDWKQ